MKHQKGITPTQLLTALGSNSQATARLWALPITVAVTKTDGSPYSAICQTDGQNGRVHLYEPTEIGHLVWDEPDFSFSARRYMQQDWSVWLQSLNGSAAPTAEHQRLLALFTAPVPA